jgi:hypothetical protein
MNISGLDNTLYPHLAAYLNALPSGMDSYPAYTTRSDFTLLLRPHLQEALDAPTLRLQRPYLTKAYSPGAWIPETVYAALCALARDRLWQSDTSFHRGMADVANVMYTSPLYRALMLLFSPHLIVMGAGSRWTSFHQGTSLVFVKRGNKHVEAEIAFPLALFSEPSLRSIGATFCSAISGAGGADVNLTLKLPEKMKAHFLLTWT